MLQKGIMNSNKISTETHPVSSSPDLSKPKQVQFFNRNFLYVPYINIERIKITPILQKRTHALQGNKQPKTKYMRWKRKETEKKVTK